MKFHCCFLYKLLAGFGVIGLFMVVIFAFAAKTIDENTDLINKAIISQVRKLARVNHLQSEAGNIRILESELPKITDIFATTGTISQLRQKSALFENDLWSFLQEFFPPEDQDAHRLKEEWRLYVKDLERTIYWVQEMTFDEALKTSTYYSRPRFQTFAQTLKELNDRIEHLARKDHEQAVLQLNRKRSAFLALSLTGIILSFTIAILLSRSLSVRLLALRRGALLLADNQMKEPISVAGTDEVGELAAAFNTMRIQVQKREDELRQAQDELESRVEQRTAALAQTNRELDAFVYTLSHDLRSPLGIIASTANFLRDSHPIHLDKTALDFLTDIEKQSEKMLELMEDLLELARVGELEPPTQPIDTVALVKGIIDSQREQIKAADVQVRVERMPLLRVPKTLLHQIFANLIANAVRYGHNKTGGIIEVGGTRQGEMVQLFVRDHGPGVPEEEREGIFNVFFRGTTGKRVQGTGVGLATVAKIARLYSGRAWVEETPGGGATFRVEIADISPAANGSPAPPVPINQEGIYLTSAELTSLAQAPEKNVSVKNENGTP